MCNGQSLTTSSPAPHVCGCGGHGPSESRRQVDSSWEMEMPAVTFPSSRVLAVAGETRLRELVRRHHALLLETPAASLFPGDPAVFAQVVEKVADFIVEACGGESGYTQAHGNVCMRTRHFPFTIDETAREIWLAALYQAMQEVAFPEELRQEYWDWLEPFSVRMINRRTMRTQPLRLSYAEAAARFAVPVVASEAAPDAGNGCGCGQGRLCRRA